MTFGEKLDRLTADTSKSRVSRQAGLPVNAVSDYINKGYLPRLDTAFRLATALKVSLDWLADDAKEWPPPSPGDAAQSLSDAPFSDLIHEVARRYRLEILEAMKRADAVEHENWNQVANELKGLKPGEEPSSQTMHRIQRLLSLFEALDGTSVRYDLHVAADFLHEFLPGREKKLEDVQHATLLKRVAALNDQVGIRDVLAWLMEVPSRLSTGRRPLGLATIFDLMDAKRRAALLAKFPANEQLPKSHGALLNSNRRLATDRATSGRKPRKP